MLTADPNPDLIRIEAGSGVLELAPTVGGAIASFRVGDLPILRPTSDGALAARDVLGFACYPLVPYSNRIAGARLCVGESTFALSRNLGDMPHAIHGVGWQRRWSLGAHDPSGATIELSHVPTSGETVAWPFAFRAWQSFALRFATNRVALTATIGIESRDERPFPFGLGFHPFFPKRPGSRLGFRAGGVWMNDSTQCPHARVEPPAEWRFDPARPVDGIDLDHVFTDWDGRATIVWPDMQTTLVIDADRALSHLVVYMPADGDFLAVEPVTHMTDAFNRAARGEAATGTRTLAPGQSFSCTMRLTVSSRD